MPRPEGVQKTCLTSFLLDRSSAVFFSSYNAKHCPLVNDKKSEQNILQNQLYLIYRSCLVIIAKNLYLCTKYVIN